MRSLRKYVDPLVSGVLFALLAGAVAAGFVVPGRLGYAMLGVAAMLTFPSMLSVRSGLRRARERLEDEHLDALVREASGTPGTMSPGEPSTVRATIVPDGLPSVVAFDERPPASPSAYSIDGREITDETTEEEFRRILEETGRS